MDRPAIDLLQLVFAFFGELGEKTLRPVEVATIRTGGDQRERAIELRQPCGVAAVFDSVLVGSEIAATAPGLIAYAPVVNAKRIPIPLRGAQICQRTLTGRGVAILNPLIKILWSQASHVRREVWLRASQSAEAHKLIRAEPIWLVLLRTIGRFDHEWVVDRYVRAARPLGARACTVAPIVAVGKTAAGPAHYWELERTQRVD